MGQLIESLRNLGCDMDGAMDRFLNDEDFYQKCMKGALDDPAFVKLGEALQTGNVEEAFEQAHLLKGLLANMGLTPLYELMVKIVEPLRKKNGDGLIPVYQQVMAEKVAFLKLLEENS